MARIDASRLGEGGGTAIADMTPAQKAALSSTAKKTASAIVSGGELPDQDWQANVQGTTVFTPVKQIVDRYGDAIWVDATGKDESGNIVFAGPDQSKVGGSPNTSMPNNGGGGNGSGSTDTSKADAYQRLYDEFNVLGLGALVSEAKDLIMKSTSISGMPDALRASKVYTDRFSANDSRIKAGLAALSPAEYLAKEDAYQNIMRNYGLPESYYKTGLYGKQEGFEKLLAGDVSAVELEDRIATAQQRVLNSNPEVLSAIKNFYGDSVTNGDILAYALNPSKGLEDIKKKVTAAEIQGAANAFGLNKITAESTPDQIKALEARANALAGYGVTKAAATEGYANVAEMVPRGSQLADIYKQTPYTQATAESEVFNTTGAAEAKAKRKKITELEKASFSGSSGVGALGRDRATNYGNTQSGFGQY